MLWKRDPSDYNVPSISLGSIGLAYFVQGKPEAAAFSVERALAKMPDNPFIPLALAAVYGSLGRDQEARAAVEKYVKNFGVRPNLFLAMTHFSHFEDPELEKRWADGLLKAGLQGKPGGYYKIYQRNRLTGQEIKNLIFGQVITGMSMGKQWRLKITKEGTFNQSGFDPDAGDKGKAFIEGDMLCMEWDEHSGDPKSIYPIFRNPEGTAELKNEYFAANNPEKFRTFSVEVSSRGKR